MLTTTQYINLSLQIWGFVLTAIVIFCLYLNKGTNAKTRNVYTVLLLFNVGVMFFDAWALYFRGGVRPIDWWGVRASNLLGFCCGATVPTLFVFYLMFCFNRPEVISRVPLRISRIVCIVYWLLYGLNLFIPFFYRIDEQNIYHRLPLYPLTFIPAFVNIALSFYLLYRYRTEMEKSTRAVSIVYLLIPIPVFIVQMFVYGLNLVNFASMIVMMLLFLFSQSELAKKMTRQENELSSAKADIILSRVRPHFIYNVLNSIYHLCEFDPATAQKAIKNFSTYLRDNLDALNQTEPITFADELKHLRNYLSLEEIRFDEKLNVIYDLQVTEFSLPALTVQPLVENAVVHGVSRKEGGGTLVIATRETDSDFRVIVSDDGVGFDPVIPPDDSRSHIGIQSVSDRLSVVCGGTLTVESTVGGGTTATIAIPKEGAR